MDEKNQNVHSVNNVNNTTANENKTGKKKKKGVFKAVIIILSILIALIIGGLSWMLISGNDFSTIIDNISNGFENKKDKNAEAKDENDSRNENSSANKDDITDITKKDNNAKNDENKGDASGKGADASDFDTNFSELTRTANASKDFRLVYLTNGVRNITIEGASFVCKENDPHITGISIYSVDKIEKYVKDHYNKVWEDINAQTSDEYIKEILNGMNENSKKNPDYVIEDIGFTQSCRDIFLTTKLVTIKMSLEGGLGGVSWGSTTGASFWIGSGDVIKISDIVTSKDEYLAACKKAAFKQLKNDSRYDEVISTHKDEYEEIINTAIEKMDGYFVRDGIVCAEIPKYAIASGACGEFKFIVPYSEIKDYIDQKYLDDIDITGESYKKKSDDTYKKNKYSTEQLKNMAFDYYESKTGYRPTGVYLLAKPGGEVSIELYDNMGDHKSACDWYTVDPETATGTDMMGNYIDLKVKPARVNN